MKDDLSTIGKKLKDRLLKKVVWIAIFSIYTVSVTAQAISVPAQSTDKILVAENIIKLIPDKITGFYANEDSKSKVIKLGTIQYSMAERNFSATRDRSIKILLFDYKEASIMYNQATKKFNTFTPVESDSLILRSFILTECSGWESYNSQKKNSQILLGICNRFFLTIEGTNVDLDFLKSVVQTFKFDLFPK